MSTAGRGTGQLTYEVRGGTALVTIDNPAKRNAMNTAMWEQWQPTMARAVADPAVRVVVVTGAPGAFCAGADIDQLGLLHTNEVLTTAHEAIARCPKPTIASIDGSCVGAGVLIAAACDIRLAGTTSRFGIPPANLGVIYPRVPLERLVRLLGPAATKYLVFTADLIGAERARHIGLVDEILPGDVVLDRALKLATAITGRSQLTIQATKSIVDAMVDRTLTDAIFGAWLAEVEASPDMAEGRAAFLEHRTPQFTWNGAGLDASAGDAAR